MASMDIYNDISFEQLFQLDFAGLCTEALNEAAPILEANMKKTARASILHEGESEMVNSIKASKPKKSKNGAYIVNVGPRGYSSVKIYRAKNSKGVRTGRKYSVSNALKAIWKEYGIPGRQAPRPFMTAATNQSESQVLEIIQRKFDQKVDV
ncbi:MAG: hypothetical protein KBT03_12780 [Bacteroidales bacterium]|nr:hypothetical protein [Candidatus Scybalousia scybalohippi]